jgi:hypothetical protein
VIIELSKNAPKKQVAEALAKLSQSIKNKKGKGNIAHHFGKLKTSEDGLAFQKRVRSEWD